MAIQRDHSPARPVTPAASFRLWLLIVPFALLAAIGCEAGRFTAESGWSGAVVAGDVVYIGSRQAELLALDRQRGTLLWRFPSGGEENLVGIYGSPAVTDDLIYVGAYGEELGRLYAIDPVQRAKVWDYPTGDHIVGSPVVSGETVLVGSSDGILYALDAATGVEQWRFQTANKIWSTPVVHEGTVYLGSLDHNVYAISLDEGVERWRFTTGGAVASTPLVAGRSRVHWFIRQALLRAGRPLGRGGVGRAVPRRQLVLDYGGLRRRQHLRGLAGRQPLRHKRRLGAARMARSRSRPVSRLCRRPLWFRMAWSLPATAATSYLVRTARRRAATTLLRERPHPCATDVGGVRDLHQRYGPLGPSGRPGGRLLEGAVVSRHQGGQAGMRMMGNASRRISRAARGGNR